MKKTKTKKKALVKSAKENKKKKSQLKKFVNSLKIGTPMLISWDDAYSRSGWREIRDVKSSQLHVKSVGLYMDSDNDFIYCGTGRFDDTESFCDVHGFPWGMLTDIKILR